MADNEFSVFYVRRVDATVRPFGSRGLGRNTFEAAEKEANKRGAGFAVFGIQTIGGRELKLHEVSR